MAHAAEISAELLCDGCGYDLRAHPQDGKCPECGASVAESRRLAAIPRRPAWRDSDPRWRRRMLAGAWILVLIPLMDALLAFAWTSNIPIPNVFGFPGALRLGDTLLSWMNVYQSLIFCSGVVLLFSKERGRRSNCLDWTRRWGVICSYVVLLLNAASVLIVGALVLAGIGALFLSMPLKYQPEVTQFFVNVSTAILLYGPYTHDISYPVLAAFSSIVILLACIPLLNALRSSGPSRPAAILLAPLAFFALMHLAQAGLYCVSPSSGTSSDVYLLGTYFRPQLLAGRPIGQTYLNMSGSMFSAFLMEATKWGIILAIAVWLTIAQFAAWRHGRKWRSTKPSRDW